MRVAVITAWTLVAGPVAAPAQVFVGPEFTVAAGEGEGRGVAIAHGPAQEFVVLWDGLDGDGLGVFARRFAGAGDPIGGPFRVNTYTTGGQVGASAAIDAAGNLVVAWTESSPGDSLLDVRARRYDAAGSPLGPEFRANDYTTGNQLHPSVAVAADGRFVVAWQGGLPFLGSNVDVFARRYAVDGTPAGPEFLVHEQTTGYQSLARVVTDVAGGFAVVWTEYATAIGNGQVHGRLFFPDGNPRTEDFEVSADPGAVQGWASVAMRPSGEFVVAWQNGQDGSALGVSARQFGSDATPRGAEFVVNTYTTGQQLRSAVSLAANGSFVVTWEDTEPFADGSGSAVKARFFAADGLADGSEFVVNTYTTASQWAAAVAPAPNGDFVVAWTNSSPPAPEERVAARFVRSDSIFRDGFESGDLSAWSVAAVDGGDLAVDVTAAMKGSGFGLRAVVDDSRSLFVEDHSPRDERRYRARFYLDPNGFDPGEAQNHRRVRLFLGFEENPSRRVFALVLRRLAGHFALMGRARLDDNNQRDTGFFDITDAPHWVEIDWRAASAPGAADGAFELWIDGASLFAATDLANGAAEVDFVRLGALNLKSGASGTLRWDEFESRRLTAIGP
jgi:hypothetical protein